MQLFAWSNIGIISNSESTSTASIAFTWWQLVSLLDALNWANSRGIASKAFCRSYHQSIRRNSLIKAKELGALDAILAKSQQWSVQKIANYAVRHVFKRATAISIYNTGLVRNACGAIGRSMGVEYERSALATPVKLNPYCLPNYNAAWQPNASAGIQSEFASLVQQRLMWAPWNCISYAIKEDERELRHRHC